ncbi:MAG: hypothetical protein AB4426_06325 [Xenococcaceae cyanobacterium]
MTTSVKITRVYEEVIDFIAAGTTPESVIDFQLSDAAKEHLEDLVYRAKTEGLPPDEKRELDEFLRIEHVMMLAKTRAHKYVKSKSE